MICRLRVARRPNASDHIVRCADQVSALGRSTGSAAGSAPDLGRGVKRSSRPMGLLSGFGRRYFVGVAVFVEVFFGVGVFVADFVGVGVAVAVSV
jgi:hypothetical protein